MIDHMAEKENMLKRNWPIVVPIGILVAILVCFMFAFIVDENDHVIVTRVGAPQLEKNTAPGLRWKLPYPIEEVWRHDKRVHVFPSTDADHPTKGEFEEVYTADKINIIVSVSLTWSVWADESLTDMKKNIVKYMNNVGTAKDAEVRLNDLVRSAKTSVFGKHTFGELVNEDKSKVRIDVIEDELHKEIREQALDRFAIDVKTVSISHVGLPEKTSKIVFDRMKAERKREADRIKAEGERDASNIRAQGDRESRETISKAKKEATKIRAEGDLAASDSYKTFQKAPELAMFLRQLKALPALVEKRTFLYLDFTTPPLNIMSPEVLRNLQNNSLKVKTVNGTEKKAKN
jgi:membrane protease subunit HflC